MLLCQPGLDAYRIQHVYWVAAFGSRLHLAASCHMALRALKERGEVLNPFVARVAEW